MTEYDCTFTSKRSGSSSTCLVWIFNKWVLLKIWAIKHPIYTFFNFQQTDVNNHVYNILNIPLKIQFLIWFIWLFHIVPSCSMICCLWSILCKPLGYYQKSPSKSSSIPQSESRDKVMLLITQNQCQNQHNNWELWGQTDLSV